jgi:hypothetical protein
MLVFYVKLVNMDIFCKPIERVKQAAVPLFIKIGGIILVILVILHARTVAVQLILLA